MKTAEQRKADREARFLADVTSPRTGYARKTKEGTTEPSPVVQGLQLSDVQLWPLDRFKVHPSNHVFDSSKTETYWRDLRRDILEAGAILNPLIALPDGTLLEGHSRLRIARELAAEGKDLGRVPVRVIASPVTSEETERRVFLGNLSRFELDEETRLALYAKVWPGYFLEKPSKGGRLPAKVDTMSAFPKSEIAKASGKSERQVQRDRATVQKADKIAKKKGKHGPDAEDIREAREKAAAKRKASEKAKPRLVRHLPQPLQALGIVVELSPAEVDEMIVALSIKPNAQRRRITEKLRSAKRSARKAKKGKT